MLKVKVAERRRYFDVAIGAKVVGNFRGWPGNYDVYECKLVDGKWKDEYVETQPTMRRAGQALLCHLGFGKAKRFSNKFVGVR